MKKLFTTLLACVAAIAANSQTVTISPLPQQISWGDQAFAKTEKFYLVGASQADADAVELLSSKLDIVGTSEKVDAKKFPAATPIIIGEANDKAVKKFKKLKLQLLTLLELLKLLVKLLLQEQVLRMN